MYNPYKSFLIQKNPLIGLTVFTYPGHFQGKRSLELQKENQVRTLKMVKTLNRWKTKGRNYFPRILFFLSFKKYFAVPLKPFFFHFSSPSALSILTDN